MGDILFCSISLFLYKSLLPALPVKPCNSPCKGWIIAKKSVSMKLCKAFKQPWNIIFSCRSLLTHGQAVTCSHAVFFCCDFRRRIHVESMIFSDLLQLNQLFSLKFQCIFLFLPFFPALLQCRCRSSSQSILSCSFRVYNLVKKSVFQTGIQTFEIPWEASGGSSVLSLLDLQNQSMHLVLPG